MLHPVVLSGGSGSRLWPLSRQNQPKQFLSLIGDNSLYQETVLRASKLPHAQPPVTVCSEDHRFMVGEQLQAVDIANGGILLQDLEMPDFRDYAVAVPDPGRVRAEATRVLGGFLRDVMRRNLERRDFRVFGPDETESNRLGDLFEVTDRTWVADCHSVIVPLCGDGRKLFHHFLRSERSP